MNYRLTLLSSAIALSLAFAAQAQDSGDAQATDLDPVQVVGIRASLEKSLDTKRNNTGISEAITAEDIGKFPSTKMAEALSQNPGVTLDRRFRQGEHVSIDGTNPCLNLSFLDGHPVAQAIWLYGEQPSRASITPCWLRKSWAVQKFSNRPKRASPRAAWAAPC